MQNFVQRGGRPDSPKTGRPPSASRRREIAANAKVAVTRTTNNQQEPVQYHPPPRRQSGGHGNASVNSQQSQAPQQGHGSHVKQDQYDTDAGSIDTTARGSMVQVKNSQETEHGDEESKGDEETDDDESEDGDEEFDELPWDEDEIRVLEKAGLIGASEQEQYNHLVSKGFRKYGDPATSPDMFGGASSYPSTTSGNLGDLSHGFLGEQGHGSEDFDDKGHVSPSPQRPVVANHSHRQLPQQPFHRPASAAGMAPLRHNNVNLFEQSAAIRGNNRSDTGLKPQLAQAPPRNATGLPSSQPPTYSQITRQPDRAPVANSSMRQNSHLQSNQALPQRGAGGRISSNPARLNVPQPVEPPPLVEPPTQAKQNVPVKLPTPQRTEEVLSVHETETGPIEDYDRPALFDMDYDQLNKEDFDTVPRAAPPVLSDDMLQKQLSERLEHVQKSLDATDQAKFFSSIPTAEWEEAGDWFLDQFSGIINRTKEARQAKRKLAMNFEREVDERHKHVAKKHHQVEVSLNKMKAQGQSLLPRSPGRGSKSPAKRE